MNRRCLWLVPALWSACAFSAEALKPDLAQVSAGGWRLAGGVWEPHEGAIRQTNSQRRTAAIMHEPAFGDVRLTAEVFIHPTGNGVRAAAILLGATGTMTYTWIHLDSKNRQVIVTGSTPQNTWLEFGRRGFAGLTHNAWHQITCEVKGEQVTVSIAGAEAITATAKGMTPGRVGFGTSQGDVSFRNLSLEGEMVTMAEPLRDETPPYQIISRGEAAGPYQAFPDACRLANGDILCVFYAGYGHVSLPNEQWPRGGRVCLVRSSDEGRTWTEARVLYDDPQDNRDPHVAHLSDGTLVCSFFNYWRDGARTRFRSMISRSTDGGETWEATGQPVTPEMWALSAPVREMPDGTLVLGVYTEDGGKSYGGVVRSKDKGRTWSDPIPIGKDANIPLDAETDVILLQDGALYAALRSSKVNMHFATSPDLGVTWSPVQDIGFRGHAPHFTRLKSGMILLTHRIPETALHVSRDDAKTWHGPYAIDHVGGAYPATVELRDGTVLAIYYEEGTDSAVRALRIGLKPDGVEWLRW